MTRPTSTWKNIERKVAAILGGQRVPSSGNGAIKGDVRHEHLLIEVKYGKQVPVTIDKWMAEAHRDAQTETGSRARIEGRSNFLLPLVVVQRPRGDAAVVMSLEDFAAVARKAGIAPPEPTPGFAVERGEA